MGKAFANMLIVHPLFGATRFLSITETEEKKPFQALHSPENSPHFEESFGRN